MDSLTFRRICAYALDYIFIILLTTMVSQIRFLNPSYDEYVSAYNDYAVMYDEVMDGNFDAVNSAEFKNIYYNLDKYSVSVSISTIVIYLLYFVGFQKWNHNQTLGKKAFNISVTSKNKKVSIWQMLLRTLIIYNIIFEVLSLLALWIFDANVYLYVDMALTFIASVFFYVNGGIVIFSKKHLGIHDLICKTEVKDVVNNGN